MTDAACLSIMILKRSNRLEYAVDEIENTYRMIPTRPWLCNALCRDRKHVQ